MTATGGLEAVLVGLHAAIDGYGEAGAALVRLQASVPLLAATRSGFDALRTSRDQLSEAITEAGGTPPQARAGYALPFPLNDVAAVVRLLTGLEDRLCTVVVAAIGSAAGRLLMADVLSAAAVRAMRLRLLAGSPVAKAVSPLPGIPGRL